MDRADSQPRGNDVDPHTPTVACAGLVVGLVVILAAMPAAAQSIDHSPTGPTVASASPNTPGTSLSSRDTGPTPSASPSPPPTAQPTFPSLDSALHVPMSVHSIQPLSLLERRQLPVARPVPVIDPGAIVADVEQTADSLRRQLRLFGPDVTGLRSDDSGADSVNSVPDPLRARGTLLPGWSGGPTAHIRIDF